LEKDSGQAGDSVFQETALQARRARLAELYRALPPYGSAEFWHLLERGEEVQTLPLEVLVRVLREEAIAREDRQAQRRIFAVIIARLQRSNEQWIHAVLSGERLLSEERQALAADLYADLCEQLLRTFLDPKQRFWEEAFHHCLRFARRHVYKSFMSREGYWRKATPGRGQRVPRALLESLERVQREREREEEWDVPDERAEQAFLLVEQQEVAALLSCLPVHLRTIVWLVFWEDCSMKRVGELLGISDRTVRNRLRAALAQLRRVLVAEQEVVDGASA